MAKENGNTAAAQPAANVVIGKTRSPNYPAYKLETALKKATMLHEAFKRHQVPVTAAMEKLGLTIGSSSGSQTLAALKAFGLVDVHGRGDTRKVNVTDNAAKMLASPPHPDRPALLRKAALLPKLHSELHQQFVTTEGIAPDATIKHYLIFDRAEGKFNEDVVDTFIRQFRSTLSFAGLGSSPETSPVEEEGQPSVAVGDYIQWESQGAMQFTEPRRVGGRADDGNRVFVDGSPTGIPIDQVRRADPQPPPRADGSSASSLPPAMSSAILGTPPPNPFFRPNAVSAGNAGISSFKEDKFTAETGEVIVRWPAALTSADYDDLVGWFDMLKRKIKRSVKDIDDNSQG